jgi:uncharacterized SAM-binding protein YcdF (DUF218 family)
LAFTTLLYLLSTTLVANTLLRLMQRPYKPISLDSCSTASAVVPLAGGLQRFDAAVRLLLAGKAPILILTNPESAPQYSGSAQQLRGIAIGRGIDAKDIVITSSVNDTCDEARTVAQTAHRLHLKSMILVTSADHLPRAMLLFQRQGLAVIPFPVDFGDLGRNTFRSFLPSMRGIMTSKIMVHELLGRIKAFGCGPV